MEKGSSEATPPLQRKRNPFHSFEAAQTKSFESEIRAFHRAKRFAGAGASLRSTPSPPESFHPATEVGTAHRRGVDEIN